jgi:flagellar motor component MotA
MSNVHGSTLLLERIAINNAAKKFSHELEGGYSIRATRFLSFFIAQLLNSTQSIHHAIQNMLPVIVEPSPQKLDRNINTILQLARKFREESMKEQEEERSPKVLEDLQQAIRQLI